MDIQKEKDEILKELQEINNQMTDEVLEKATPEELLKYMDVMNEIKAKLDMLEEK